MKLTTGNVVIGDITEASKYFSLVKQMKAEMKRLHGKDRPWMQSWQTVGPGVKVHIKLIMGEPKAYIYIIRDVYSWGLDDWGQLGLGDLIPFAWIQYASDGVLALPIPTVILQEKYKKVAAGRSHSLFLSSDGELSFAGNNDCGQGGVGDNMGLAPGIYVSSNPGGIWLEEYDYGQLGAVYFPYDNPLSPWYLHDYRFLPEKIIGHFTDVSAGGFHTLALDGTDLYIWGGYTLSNSSVNIISYVPLLIGTDFVEISAGYNHSLMRKSNGDAYAMGVNNNGQLGTGDDVVTNRFEPTFIGGGFKSISAGDHHSLGLTDDGVVLAWGLDSPFINFGLSVSPPPIDGTYLSPVEIGFNDCKFICASDGYSYAIKNNGDLYVLGEPTISAVGALGLGYPIESVSEWSFVGSGYKSVSSSTAHTLAIKESNELESWGDNVNGQIGVIGNEFGEHSEDGNQPWDYGLGRIAFSYLPVLVEKDFVSASAGDSHSLAIRNGPPKGDFPVFKSRGVFYLP